ncbi:MAG: glycosyltransferase family 2 protein [Candidatus Pacearchaeota archaeon]
MKKLVSVIIVNWNGKNFLRECLTSLYSQNYKNIEVIFVDNNSNDGSVEYMKKNFPKTKIIVNKENLGFAEGNNIGYRHSAGDYILFLNNDTRVTKNFLTELIEVLESDKKIGGAQSKILLMDDPARLDSVGAFLTNTGFLYHYGITKRDSSKYNKQIDIYSAKGACMMFKREVLEKIKVEGEIFDSRYFVYFEETDMCHRVWLAGYKIVFSPKSVIYHKMGGTSGNLDNSFVQYHSFKNRINSYIKNLALISLLKILPLHILMCEAFAVFSLFRLKLQLFFSIQKAIIWNLMTLNKTLAKRKKIQEHIRKLNDKEFFHMIKKNVRITYYYNLFSGLRNYEE